MYRTSVNCLKNNLTHINFVILDFLELTLNVIESDEKVVFGFDYEWQLNLDLIIEFGFLVVIEDCGHFSGGDSSTRALTKHCLKSKFSNCKMYQSECYEESVLLHRMIIVHQSDLHCNVSAAHIARIIAEIHGLWIYVQFIHTIQVDVLTVFI